MSRTVRALALGCDIRSAAEARLNAMEQALKAYGGLMRAESLVALMRPYTSQPLSRIARLIASREILSFPCCNNIWIPMFQFVNIDSLEVHSSVSGATRYLAGTRGDWDVVSWFVERNDHLNGMLPIDLLETLAGEIARAARADITAAGRDDRSRTGQPRSIEAREPHGEALPDRCRSRFASDESSLTFGLGAMRSDLDNPSKAS